MGHGVKMNDAPLIFAPLLGARKADDCKTPMQPATGMLEIQMVTRTLKVLHQGG